MDEISFRLKALRRQHQFSLEQLSQRTGLTKSYLSKLERAVSEPSISTVLKLAQAYGIGVSQLIGSGEGGDSEAISVVRRGEREPLDRRGKEMGYRYEAMAGKRLVKAMDPFIVYPPRADEASPSSFPHVGEEFMFVLKGTVMITVGGKEHRLGAGDSIYFDSELPHKLITVGRGSAEVLVVAAKGS
ncbi:cupin domain-containing protein [Pusillimonas sp. SM2304]|uniref:cupin domain-containing protein n=1 Tax=Pusillimonas sp. SM2304 TaxID=3073241 RepID=UPI0028753D83|nr:cupin domain-containing protein [Pusillimonas sp. SM2304]MDS1139113.1 cupin domain-containing protein [Pusillimonas sp. SM2304]